jgi:DNA-directed RNA polymerase specialized sigma24 family protein
MSNDLEVLPARARGRPSLYDPANCDRVLELAAEGCGKAEIAAALQVSVKTLNAWVKAHDDFRGAMSRAKDMEYAWWLTAGRKGQFMRAWNANGWAMQMRNRFRKRFRDRFPAHEEPPKDSVNAEQLRDEMERKLSRIADAGAEVVLPGGVDAAGVEKPAV